MPTPEEIVAAYQQAYGRPPSPEEAAAINANLNPVPALPPLQGGMIGGGGAELPPGSVAPPAAPQAPQSPGAAAPPGGQVAFQAPVAQAVQPAPSWQQVGANAALSDTVPNQIEAAAMQDLVYPGAPGAGGKGFLMVPTTATSVQRTEPSARNKAALAAYLKYADQAAESGKREGELIATREAAVAEAVQKKAALQEEANKQLLATMDERDAAMQQKQADVEALRAKYTAAEEKGFTRQQSGMQRVVSAIAAAMGAFGAALTKTPNYAQEILDNQFNREYDEWKRGINAKRDQIQIGQQILNETGALFKDKIAAREAARGLYLEKGASMIEQASYLNRSEQVKEQSVGAAAKLRAEASMAFANATAREGVTVQTQNSVQPVAVGGGSANGKVDNELTRREDRDKAIDLARKALEPPAPFGEEAVKVKAQAAPVIALAAKARELEAKIKKFTVGAGKISASDIKQEYAAMRGALFNPIIVAQSGAGVPVEERKQRLDEAFGEDSWSPDRAIKALRTYVNTSLEGTLLRVDSVDPYYKDSIRKQLFNGVKDPFLRRSLEAGRVPTDEEYEKEADALGAK